MYGVEIYATVRQLVLLQGKSRREVARQRKHAAKAAGL
jgi:hypothetical protein